jgi:tetratricopeptide (TPR) repeat protein
VGVFFSVIFLNPFAQKDSLSRTYKVFQSLMKPIKTDDLNIILFTIDTLRADHLECYGYQEIKTPNINRMADEGALFQYAIVQTPLTLPSHSSIMTGTYPLFHGVRDNGGFYLDENQTTLAETLKNNGYSTAPFNYKPDFNLGLLYASNQELESAIKEFESCIAKNPDFADVYAFLAKAFMDKGEDLDHAVQMAKKHISKAQELQNTLLKEKR